MNSVPATTGARAELPPPFGRIVCRVDGSRSGHAAVEQAIALSDPRTALVFVCVRDERGAGLTQQATITAERAHASVEEAVRAARDAGVDAASEVLLGHDPRAVLLEEASRSDLLVVAGHGESRRAGIALGGIASTALHRAHVPVLVARPTPDGVRFPERVLIATDGSEGARRAVELTARIARQHRAAVTLISVDPPQHGNVHQVAVHEVDLAAALGFEPVILRSSGHPDARIVDAADAQRAALVVLGSRGLSGLHALGSVSEQVAHRARCSVLVARPA
jgi:nucleotide-binding universal stress UspA family protein